MKTTELKQLDEQIHGRLLRWNYTARAANANSVCKRLRTEIRGNLYSPAPNTVCKQRSFVRGVDPTVVGFSTNHQRDLCSRRVLSRQSFVFATIASPLLYP